MKKKKLLNTMFLLAAGCLMLSACKNQAASVPEEAFLSESMIKGDMAEKFKSELALEEGSLYFFYQDDYDKDGKEEAFAFTVSKLGDDGAFRGSEWFVDSEKKAWKLRENVWRSEADGILTTKGNIFWKLESDGSTGTTTYLWTVKEGKAVQSILSGEGGNFTQDEDTYVLYQDKFDASVDGTGRTRKPYFFFYEDGDFKEYGGSYLTFDEAAELGIILPEDIKEEWISHCYLKANGDIYVNLSDGNSNFYLRFTEDKDDPENRDGYFLNYKEDGWIDTQLVYDACSYEWYGTNEKAEKLFDQKSEYLRNNDYPKTEDVGERLPEDQFCYVDLDGDGTEEQIYFEQNNNYHDNCDWSLTVNGQKISEDKAVSSLTVVDIDTSDAKKELLLTGSGDSAVTVQLSFWEYRDGQMVLLDDLTDKKVFNGSGSFYRGEILSLPGDGTLVLYADSPVWWNNFGSYYVQIPFTFTEGKWTEKKLESYPARVYGSGELFEYEAAVSFELYESLEVARAESSYLAQVNPGQKLILKEIVPVSEDCVILKMKLLGKEEVEGFVKIQDQKIFTETPAWG